jgi:hypothetical protein
MKKTYLVIAVILVMVTLSVYGCTSNTTIIQQPTNTVNTQNTATLSSITISPTAPSNLPVGVAQTFVAYGTYSDGFSGVDISSQVTWISSDPTVATISSTGLATAIAVGSTNITAVLNGITSQIVTLTVETVSQTTTSSFTSPTFSLSSITLDTLAKINMNITVMCFFLPADDQYHTQTYALDMLGEYQKYTGDITIEIIDPTQNPTVAREYNITDSSLYESVVFKTDLGTVLVTPTEIVDSNLGGVYAENAFTNAILQVTGQQEKKVYFVVGDGEASPNSSSTLSDLSASLNTDLFQVETLNLQIATNIPSNCAVLIVVGPTTAMTASEHQIIANYLANDGCAIFLTNPNAPNDIAQLLSPWGVNVQSSTLIDPSSYVAPNMNIVSVPSSRDNVGNYNVFFSGVTAIVAESTPPNNIEVSALLWTSSNSYLDKNYNPSVTPTFDPTTEIQQSYAVGVLIRPTDIKNADGTDSGVPNPGPYIAAFGDSDFITNTNFYSLNNGDMFLKLVSELSAGSELVTIPPYQPN